MTVRGPELEPLHYFDLGGQRMVILRRELKGHKVHFPGFTFDCGQDSVLALAQDKDLLASSSADGSCRLWDLRCMRSVRAAVLKQEVSSVSLHQDQLVCSSGGTVFGFDLRSQKVLLEAEKTLEACEDEINQERRC